MTLRIKKFSIGASINAYLNLVKASLTLKIRNDLDWMPKFLALKISAFLTRIYFLDLTIF